MMDAIKYLRLDLRLMKGYIKSYLILPLLFLLFMIMNTAAFAMNYLFFFILILSATPFSLEGVGNSQKLYYSLPAKIKSMVLGRYLALISIIAIVFVFDMVTGSLCLSTGRITSLQLIAVYISAILGSVICFIQYPVFYKFGYERGRLVSMLVYMVPAMLVFALPSILAEVLKGPDIGSIVSFANDNMAILAAIGLILLGFACMVSFRLSCGICKKKELS